MPSPVRDEAVSNSPSPITGTVAISGASGYLGKRLAEHFAGSGWRVIRLLRSAPDGSGSARHYDLSEEVAKDLLDDVDVLIHAAYDLTATRREEIWRINVDGSRQLLAAARAAGVGRIIVLSSMSAYEGTTQIYGRAKLAIEAATLSAGGCVVRPGLVYGDRPGGMTGALLRLCRLPLVPLVGGSARQYPLHEADLMAAVSALATTADFKPEVLGVASPDAVTFQSLLQSLASQQGRHPRFVPVPWQILYWSLRALERLPLALPFRADSLLGLVRPAPNVPGLDRLAELGIRPRPFAGSPT